MSEGFAGGFNEERGLQASVRSTSNMNYFGQSNGTTDVDLISPVFRPVEIRAIHVYNNSGGNVSYTLAVRADGTDYIFHKNTALATVVPEQIPDVSGYIILPNQTLRVVQASGSTDLDIMIHALEIEV